MNDFKEKYIGIIGAGRVGSNIAYWLSRCGWKIRGILDINPDNARKIAHKIPTGIINDVGTIIKRCDIIFITIPDSEIIPVLEEISEYEYDGEKILVLMSGIMPASILGLAGIEFLPLSIHPLAGIPPLDIRNNPFYGIFFGMEGNDKTVKLALKIIDDLGGKLLAIEPEYRILYHTAGVFGANLIYPIIHATEKLLADSCIHKTDIRKVVTNLITHSLDNYQELGIPEAMTGPLVRDDYSTILAHLFALKDDSLLPLYIQLMRDFARIINKETEFDELTEYIQNKIQK